MFKKFIDYTKKVLGNEIGGLITKNHTFAAGATIIAAEHNANFDTVYELVNNNIEDANIKSGAAIDNAKLNLASITQAITLTNTLTCNGAVTLGNATADDITITGSIAASIPLKDETVDIGTTAIGLNDVHFGSGGIINFDGGDVTVTHSAAKLTFGGDGAVEIDFNNHEMTNVDINSGNLGGITIDGNWTAASQTCADLGTVTTCDIDGGDISSATISGGLTWSAAQDLNSQALTNADINSGTIGGVTLDGAITMSMGSDADGDIYYRTSNVLTRLAKGTFGQVIQMNEEATAPEWASRASVDVLTASGAWTCPAGVTKVFVTMIAAGGGGGGSGNGASNGGGGGAAGELVVMHPYTVSAGSYDYTIGTGGAGGSDNVVGVTGGNTIWDTGGGNYLEVNGGVGGNHGANGGAGGAVVSTSAHDFDGADTATGTGAAGGTIGVASGYFHDMGAGGLSDGDNDGGGGGGGTIFGAGGAGGNDMVNGSNAPTANSGAGGGGSGHGGGSAHDGGDGADGIIILVY